MTEDQEVSEALLSAAAAGHRVRNIREKIEDIGETSQLGRREGGSDWSNISNSHLPVKTVLDLYCAHRESVNFVLCSANSTSSPEEDQLERAVDYQKNVTNYIDLMSERLSPPFSDSGDQSGICNYHNTIVITIGVTTLLNSISFLVLLTLCKKSVKAEVNYDY